MNESDTSTQHEVIWLQEGKNDHHLFFEQHLFIKSGKYKTKDGTLKCSYYNCLEPDCQVKGRLKDREFEITSNNFHFHQEHKTIAMKNKMLQKIKDQIVDGSPQDLREIFNENMRK